MFCVFDDYKVDIVIIANSSFLFTVNLEGRVNCSFPVV